MECAVCKHPNEAAAKFCEECGAKLARACATCGASLKASAKFCPACGQAAIEKPVERSPGAYTPKHLADKILSSRSALEGERKRVTVLFSDIQGSMAMSEQLDPEEWHLVMDRFFAIMTEGIHRFEGTINQYTGDGVMALFGAPIAHEDHAQRACFAALHLQSELRKYANELRIERGLPVAARIGLNSGDVVVGRIGDDLRMDYTAQGHSVGLAARMQQIAEPGKAYLTGATADLVRGYFALEGLGRSTIKGVREPVEVFALTGLGELRTRLDVSRSRGFSRFVGRSREVESLEEAFEEVRGGQGRIVGVVAEAGTGKSRLCFEFLERCRERGVTVYETYCLPHGRTLPLFPVLELYRNVFGIKDDDSPERARDKIAGRVVLIDEKLIDTLPLLFDFLGVPDPKRPIPVTDPELRTRRILDVLRRFTAARGERDAVVVLVEDLHWMDPGSTVFFNALIDSVPSGKLLLLLNFRPEFSGRWIQKSYYQQVPLAPLGAGEIDELMDFLLGRHPTLAELRTRVRERTGGNPFFIEEITRELAEQGHIVGARGAFRLETPIDAIPVPGSVQGVLAARIDRLDDEAKQVLQAASAIGRDFPLALLATATERAPSDLAPILSKLVDDEFVYPTALYPDAEYAFKHALTRDVAYESLLGGRRRALHAALGRALESQAHAVRDERAALLAHHYEQAGELLAAARWYERAALWIGQSNVAECYEHWRKVRTLTASIEPTPEVRSQRIRACCQELMRGLRAGASVDAPALLAEARGALEGCDDPHAEIRILIAEGNVAYVDGNMVGAFPLLDRALMAARETGDDYLISAALSFWLVVQTFRDPAAAIATLDQIGEVGIDGASDYMGFQTAGWSRGFSATCAAYAGRYAESLAGADLALEHSRATDDRIDLAITLGLVACVCSLWGDRQRALACVREARRLGEATGVRMAVAVSCACVALTPDISGFGMPVEELEATVQRLAQVAFGFQQFALTFLRAQLALARGDMDAALDLVRQASERVRSTGMRTFIAPALLAEAEILTRMHGGAARAAVDSLLSRARSSIEEMGTRSFAPRVHILRAALEAAAGNHAAAEREREMARRLCEEMGAPVPA